MLERGLKDRRHGGLGHQGGGAGHGCGVLPGHFFDQDAAGKEKMRHAPYFEPNILQRTRFRRFPIPFMNVEPQPEQTLEPGRVARFGRIDRLDMPLRPQAVFLATRAV
jgi:hypothetical protein